MDELTLNDYASMPISKLLQHHSFSLAANNKVTLILGLTTTQIENLDLTGVMPNG